MRLLIAGGGTGGHLYPGLALAAELRRRDPAGQIDFVGTARGLEVRAVPQAGFPLHLLPVQPLRGGGLMGLGRGLAVLPLALWAAVRLIRRLRPQVAVSVGGYAAGPAVMAARLCGVPCLVLEQNAVAGLTNRVLARLATQVLASLPVTNLPRRRLEVIGNPVRAEFAAVRAQPYVAGSRLRLLVLGGSQGARALNEALMAAAPELARLPLVLHHQTGTADAVRVRAAYAAAGFNAQVEAFIADMAGAYAACDLVLCRAGASTLAEICVCGRPAILVPYPFAADDHQSANAQVLSAAGAAILVPQPALTAAHLTALLSRLVAAPAPLAAMAAAARALGRPDAVAQIADRVLAAAH